MDGIGTVLITGGSRGIGAATVRLVAAAGYDVCVTYATQQAVADALVSEVEATGRRALCLQADVSEEGAVERVLERIPATFQPLVALVNNAGITGPLGAFLDATPQTMRQVFDINVLGTMLFSQGLARHWRANAQPGCIVNVSSIAATLGSAGDYVHYAASKAAVETFTIGLGRELAEHGIRVNCVSPGIVQTEIHATAGEPGRPQRLASRIPMRRPGEAHEVAEAILWLLSARSSYVTGTVLKVGGGL